MIDQKQVSPMGPKQNMVQVAPLPMCMDIYIQKEAKKDFKGWTSAGLSFLLQQKEYRETATIALSKLLEKNQSVEFKYDGVFYEVLKSADSGYVVNTYSSNKKEDGGYIEANLIYGGLCTGSARDVIEFML